MTKVQQAMPQLDANEKLRQCKFKERISACSLNSESKMTAIHQFMIDANHFHIEVSFGTTDSDKLSKHSSNILQRMIYNIPKLVVTLSPVFPNLFPCVYFQMCFRNRSWADKTAYVMIDRAIIHIEDKPYYSYFIFDCIFLILEGQK